MKQGLFALILGVVVLPLAGRDAGLAATTQSSSAAPDGQWSDWIEYSRGELPVPGSELQPTLPLVQTRPKTAQITVNYMGFPATEAPAVQAVEHAAEIIETHFVSATEIRIRVTWKPLEDPVLGRVSSRWYTKDPVDDPNLPQPGVLYPSALATVYRGRHLDDEPDIQIEISSSVPWHTAADGNPPRDRYDLVTVALHEMLQGFGISSTLDSASATTPTVYDLFVTGPDGTPVYKHPRTTMIAELVGGELRFSGPSATVAAGGTPPLLLAQPGRGASNLDHLDDWYADADPDAIMAAFLPPGWALHDPGPITLAILKDIGWTISGLGTATRLRITSQEPGLVWLGRPLPVPLTVAVQDPVGVAVRGTSPEITLEVWGIWSGSVGFTCPGGRTRIAADGSLVYDGCTPSGSWTAMHFRAVSPGLATGFHHAFRLAPTIHRSFVPSVVRTR